MIFKNETNSKRLFTTASKSKLPRFVRFWKFSKSFAHRWYIKIVVYHIFTEELQIVGQIVEKTADHGGQMDDMSRLDSVEERFCGHKIRKIAVLAPDENPRLAVLFLARIYHLNWLKLWIMEETNVFDGFPDKASSSSH